MVSKGAKDYPQPTSPAATAVMRGVPRSDTKPEKLIRSGLHRLGYRFRKNVVVQTEKRRCRSDILMPKFSLAIFIDGCFWHCCPEHGKKISGRNHEYWSKKWSANRRRDELDRIALEDAGWRVLRVWEHVPIAEAVALIAEEARRSTPQGGG